MTNRLLPVVALFLCLSCEERVFVAKGRVESGNAKFVAPAAAQVRIVDPRMVTIRFDGGDEATMVNPEMDYRFHVLATNNSDQVIARIKGVASVRSTSGSDLLVNHPFTLVGPLSPSTNQRFVIEVPLASRVAERGQLRLKLVSVDSQ